MPRVYTSRHSRLRCTSQAACPAPTTVVEDEAPVHDQTGAARGCAPRSPATSSGSTPPRTPTAPCADDVALRPLGRPVVDRAESAAAREWPPPQRGPGKTSRTLAASLHPLKDDQKGRDKARRFDGRRMATRYQRDASSQGTHVHDHATHPAGRLGFLGTCCHAGRAPVLLAEVRRVRRVTGIVT